MQLRLVRTALLSVFLGLLFFTSLMAAAAPGDTDIIVKAHIPGGNNEANAIIVQPDGKYLTAGYARFGTLQFSVTRYNTDGTVDTSFADNGTLFEPIGAGDSIANGIALQADGKIVVTGVVTDAGASKFAVARFDSTGHLDTSFGGGGAATTVGTASSGGNALAIQPDGNIVVAGFATNGTQGFALARYTTGATLDGTFGSGGTVVTGMSGAAPQARAVVLQGDGKILVGGDTGGGPSGTGMVARYNSNGTLDTSFGTSGIVTLSAFETVRDLALQSDGKVVVGGQQQNSSGIDFLVGRLNADGSTDAGFGTAGVTHVAFFNGGTANSVIVQSDGKIAAGGSGTDHISNGTAIVRLTSAGALDATFGSSGVAFAHVSPTGSDNMARMAITADGRYVLAGSVITNQNAHDEHIERFTSAGALDTTFNGTGFNQQDLGSQAAAAKATVLQPDGKIVVAGYTTLESTTHPGTPDSLVLARYNTDGTLDAAFGTGGITMPANTNEANAVALQGDGKIVTAGFQFVSGQRLVQVARFGSNGTLDSSFGTGGLVNISVNGVDDEATGVAIQPDGKIVVGGFSKNGTFTDSLAIRLTTTGALDPALLGTGEVLVQMSTGNDQANGIALQSDGKIVLAGSAEVSGGNDAFAAARLNTDGTLDSGFGTGGVVNTTVGSFQSDGFAVAIQGDGRIVVGGLAFNGSTDDFAVLRYNTNGTLDTSFGTGGKAVNDLGNHNRIFALQMLGNGEIAVAGEWAGAFTAGLYTAGGALDTSFGSGGAVFLQVNFNAGADHAWSLAIQSDGKWVLAGDGSGLFAWARLFGEAPAVTMVNPTVALASSANPSSPGQNVTFTATVSGSAGTPTGTVNFVDGSTSLAGCSAVALSSGTATCSTAALSQGLHSISANYSGDAAYNAGTSNAVTQNVQTNPVLTVSKAGSGTGTVTSAPAGINCGATCSAAFASGTMVSLSAAADTGSTFAGWSGGGCSGTGACSVTVSAATTVTATFTASTNPARLFNISTRADVLTGDNVMIGGFIIGGSTPKTVAIVATGPSLSAFGVSNPLPNPTLTLVRQSDSTVIATNDDWQTDPNAAQLQASGFAPTDPRESGIVINLPPGAYTAIVAGKNGVTGVSVVAVYEIDHPEVPLVNISTRSLVQTGNNVMIAGLIIQGDGPQTVVISATGPSLSAFGVSNPLANPTLQLVRSSDSTVIATNDNWGDAPNAAQIQASGFAPTNSLESAIMVTLDPGAYTAIVQGADGGTGVSVVGVFKVQ